MRASRFLGGAAAGARAEGTADVNQDGRYEIRVFDAATGTVLQTYFAVDPAFTGTGFGGGTRR